MGKRKLKKWVKPTMLLASMVMFGGMIKAFGYEPRPHAETEVVVEDKKELSYLEVSSINSELAVDAKKENKYHYDTFFLYESDSDYVYMLEESMDKIFVDKKIVEDSYATIANVGDNFVLHGDGVNINMVEITGGHSVSMSQLMLSNMYVTGLEFETEDGDTFIVDKEFSKLNELNEMNIGGVATGYFYKNNLISIKKGW